MGTISSFADEEKQQNWALERQKPSWGTVSLKIAFKCKHMI